MSQKDNIKLCIKKTGNDYKVVNNSYTNSNGIKTNKYDNRNKDNDNKYTNKTTTYQSSTTDKYQQKGAVGGAGTSKAGGGNAQYRSWISCPCVHCNVIDQDKIIQAAQYAMGQAKKEMTDRRAKCKCKKY